MAGPRRFCALTVLLMLAVLLAAGSSLATDYYVDVHGDNTADGDVNHPWNSMLFAATKVQPGDNVYVEPGNYMGFQLSTSGTADQRITFKALGSVIIDHNASSGDGINLEGASYVTIDGFTSINHTRAGFRSVSNTGVIIENCTADSNEVWGILTGFSDNILIQNNVCSRSVEQHGIYLSNTCTGGVIRNNTCWGNGGCGIHMNGDVSMGGVGIITNATVENNIIYNNGAQGGSGINMDGVQNSIICNNLLYGNTAGGITAFDQDASQGPGNDVIANNTVIMPSTGRWALNLSAAVGPINVFNNVFYFAGSKNGAIEVDAATKAQLASDYNGVIGRFSTNGGGSTLALSSWQSSTGQDLHSVSLTSTNIASQFLGYSTNNYHLSPTSLLFNTGTDVNAPSWDLEGTPRPVKSVCDIGAYERIMPGDANADGTVSFADYLVLEANFGKSGATWLQGDFNRDGKVSFADYLVLESNFGHSIPEPATLALLLAGLAALRRRA